MPRDVCNPDTDIAYAPCSGGYPLYPRTDNNSVAACVELYELMESRQKEASPDGDVWTLFFVVAGTDNEHWVNVKIHHATDGLPRIFQSEPLREWKVERIGYLQWKVTAVYGYRGIGTTQDGFRTWSYNANATHPQQNYIVPDRVSISNSGGSERITRVIKDVARSTDAPDIKGVAGWDGKQINGVDILVSNTRWSEIWKMHYEEIFRKRSEAGMFPNLSTMGVLPSRFPSFQQSAIFEESAINKEYYADDYYKLNDLSLFDRWDRMTGCIHGYDWVWKLHLKVGDKYLADGKYGTLPFEQANYLMFRNFYPGSIQFAGVTATQLDNWWFEVTFDFNYKANTWERIPQGIELDYKWLIESTSEENPKDAGYPIATEQYDARWGTQYMIYKHGFDQIQFSYKSQESDPGDNNGKLVIPIADHLYYQQVMPYIPFQYLGIPTSPMLTTYGVAKNFWNLTKTDGLDTYYEWERVPGAPHCGAV